ncbi:MAG TPA: branched-chain amino acid ABC transporter permease [Acidiphilium sp.]|jgi:branched-chain amino acid transport system permease protein|uniref:branched-chain amino acid ABC transporter permease n=1 Tax=unclassified Acidiphilium TaxID=2617493 RepID=UPI000BDBCCF5|nr:MULTISPECIES: branched-chain amino acid ABC transporter permease [unclassified Acidiphilium]OYV87108.1 MAG: branched-chain amino acid ABC transporter permease [Acidiphilium sp. 21-68-69]OYV57033.1 MAG: branched-chain amino acid ABC transporter permease [Acidiphilium sp. 20-67-58]HQT61798.1 branched-chain amino acid ABC transporter permease [Acidiphilium sp.]HQT74530.1 branched-chain amino acid ABC transporter permease [Acidiphilium sp.]HQU12007.1 branched-chain amino acid ABC transporter pe
MSTIPKSRLAALAVFLIVLALFPLGANGYILGVLTTAFYFAVFAMSWDLLFGYAGEVNFGPTFLIGLGAYGAGMSNALLGLPVPLAIVVGALAAVAGGVALAIPALRLSGPYLGLITLVSVLLLQQAIVIFAGVTGGEIGLSVPDVLSISSAANYEYALAFMLVSGLILFLISRSSLGMILQAAGQDQVAAAALGFNATRHKILAFAVSALFSGLAGAFLVFYLGTASVSAVVDISIGVRVIIAAVLGGRRTIIGGAIGSVFLIVAGELLRPIGQLSTFVVALIALVVIVLFPDGLLGLLPHRRGA